MSKGSGGSVISSYFAVKPAETGQDIKNQGLKTLYGQIEKVHYIDDETNVSKKFVEYDVNVRDEKGGQTSYKNVRCETALGGANDFEETILEPNEVALSGQLDSSNLFLNQNGTLVYVSFRDGSLDKPYIEGSIPHPKRDGATRSDGIRKLGEFRGVEWSINKDGELTITYKSNRNPDGTFARKSTGPTQIKIDKTGALSITDNKNQKISMDRTTTTIKLSNGVSVELDGSAGSVTLKDKGTGFVKIKDSKISMGAASAELLQQISDQLQELITAFNSESSHTHMGNLGFPTAPPSNAGAMSSAASNLGTIKGKIDGIKGS